ncbi:MAG: hypothetical protein QG670_616 [Thermoproteota archaeon]|nr:hypothetical protein [Thermoproteota archaeon]
MDQTKKAVLFTVLAGVLWGSSFPVIKIGLRYIDPFMLVILRFFLASIIMIIILLFTRRFDRKFAKRSIWILGILNGVSYLLEYVGMAFTTASKSSLIINLSAVWVAVLSWLILKDRFGKKKSLGIIFSILGVFIITTNLNFQELLGGTLFGDITTLFSGIGWSLFIVLNKKFISDFEDQFQFNAWVLFITALPLIPFVPLSSNITLNLPAEAWIIIAYTAIFCSIISYYIWLKGLKHISPVTSTVVLLTEVVVAVIISYIILGEGFTLTSGIGALLILSAIILVSLDA